MKKHNKTPLKMCSLLCLSEYVWSTSVGLTITRIHNLNRGCCWWLQNTHHRLSQDNLERLGLLVFPIRKNPHSPGGCSLAGVKLYLLLSFSQEILLLLCTAIQSTNPLKQHKYNNFDKLFLTSYLQPPDVSQLMTLRMIYSKKLIMKFIRSD